MVQREETWLVTTGVQGKDPIPSPRCAHTLHHTPGVLPGLGHLVANLHLFSAADHCKWQMDLPSNKDREYNKSSLNVDDRFLETAMLSETTVE